MKPEVAVKAVKLSEDFEADKLSVDFAREDMGELDFIYSNPAPVPVNTSKRFICMKRVSVSIPISHIRHLIISLI